MSEYNDVYEGLVERSRELQQKLKRINESQRKTHSRGEDQAIERENDEVVDTLGENIREELKLIDDAIARIQNGSYGTCSECGQKISKDRLKALPYTGLCIDCASEVQEFSNQS